MLASGTVLPMNILHLFPLVSPCCPREPQESSPEPQFKSTSSSALSLLYGANLTFVHDYWKKTALTIHTFVTKVMFLLFNIMSRFIIALEKQVSFNFITAFSICSDFGAQENKIYIASTFSPSIFHEVMGPDTMILVF